MLIKNGDCYDFLGLEGQGEERYHPNFKGLTMVADIKLIVKKHLLLILKEAGS